jgi:hypothetical protein
LALLWNWVNRRGVHRGVEGEEAALQMARRAVGVGVVGADEDRFPEQGPRSAAPGFMVPSTHAVSAEDLAMVPSRASALELLVGQA